MSAPANGKLISGGMRRFLLAAILLVFGFSSFAQSAGFKIKARSNKDYPLKLRGGDILVTIQNETSAQQWDRYAFEKTRDLLDAYESYTGIFFHQAAAPIFKSLPSKERNRVRLVLKESVFLNGTRIGGYNNVSGELGKDLGIYLESGLVPIGYPALLLHELGHYYFIEPLWLSEGIVSFLPYLLAKKGYLRLNQQELTSIYDEWELAEPPSKSDHPLGGDFQSTDPQVGAWMYSKSVRLQGILYKELSPEGYRSFLRILATTDVQDTEAVLKVLHGLKAKNWEQILKGWLLPGKYLSYPIKSFSKIRDWEAL
ncbi:hypothetical protein LEP1GSC058_3344 [Leptospira fainei serovar Hurstbridge str. BUT 6]|uniref:Peptidase MA family protein n=1 Tax=Leptospira fainei serovar Hurstbridge str. BUT 6 TaxID=1193011 RepID=S3UY32_9LEPT|nr:hypothetical protein [Leptospira fainei]EPG73274.1 hypothetical protein LEP1GSC058_3344 [Leptospira fainei serovar Hurstbridge str. BUT 6]